MLRAPLRLHNLSCLLLLSASLCHAQAPELSGSEAPLPGDLKSRIHYNADDLLGPSGSTENSRARKSRGEGCAASLPEGALPRVADRNLKLKVACLEHQAVAYSPQTLSAVWAAERLTSHSLAEASRYQAFPHPPLHAEQALAEAKTPHIRPSDYLHSDWLPGLLADPANMPTRKSAWQAWSMMNTAAMHPGLYHDLWVRIRQSVTALAINPTALNGLQRISFWVVTGVCQPEVSADAKPVIGIPTAFYKALLAPEYNISGAIVAANNGSGQWEVMPLDKLQAKCGVIPFPETPPSYRAQVQNMPQPLKEVRANGLFGRSANIDIEPALQR